MRYEKCLVEVDEVLKHLVKEDLLKIPEDIRKAITENKDKEYIWNYDEEKDLTDQNLDRSSIAILSYLNIEYILNDDQRKLMNKIHKYNENKKKVKQNDKVNFFENKEKIVKVENEVIEENKDSVSEISLVPDSVNVFSRIILKIKIIFNIK